MSPSADPYVSSPFYEEWESDAWKFFEGRYRTFIDEMPAFHATTSTGSDDEVSRVEYRMRCGRRGPVQFAERFAARHRLPFELWRDDEEVYLAAFVPWEMDKHMNPILLSGVHHLPLPEARLPLKDWMDYSGMLRLYTAEEALLLLGEGYQPGRPVERFPEMPSSVAGQLIRELADGCRAAVLADGGWEQETCRIRLSVHLYDRERVLAELPHLGVDRCSITPAALGIPNGAVSLSPDVRYDACSTEQERRWLLSKVGNTFLPPEGLTLDEARTYSVLRSDGLGPDEAADLARMLTPRS